jgi:hypothetical protein
VSADASEPQTLNTSEPSSAAPYEADWRSVRLPWIFVLLAMLLTGVAMVGAWPRMNHDVAAVGLIAERVLEGDALYVDIPEVNPPLVFLLSGLVVRVSGWIGVPWRITLVLAAWAWVAASSLLVGWVCERGRLLETPRARVALTFAVFAVHASLIGEDFGQREPMFLAGFLPLVFAGAVAARGGSLPRAGVIAIAVLAALGIALKPFFAPFWVFTELVFLLHTRRRELLLRLENLIVGGLLVVYGLYVVYLTPYLDHLGEWVGPYSAYDMPRLNLLSLTLPSLLVAVVTIVALRKAGLRRESVRPLDTALFVATVPAALSVFAQAKGFPYHVWPLHALVLVGLLVVLASQEQRDAASVPGFSTWMGGVGLLLLLGSAIVGKIPLLQPAGFVMTVLAFLGDRGGAPRSTAATHGDTRGPEESGGTRGHGTPWLGAVSTWMLVASVIAILASRAVVSWIPSVRAGLDEYPCPVQAYEQPRQTCSYGALLATLDPHTQPGDGVLWITSDAEPSALVAMELGLRNVMKETFMRVPAAYTRRDDPRVSYPYHSPEQALEDERRVREGFVTSIADAKPKLVIFDRRAHAIALGAVPFDTELWFRADPTAAALLDTHYTLLEPALTVTRGTHVVYVRRE